MAIVYKLTNQDLTTHNGYQWAVGEWRETNGEGNLCGPGWLHAYTDPAVALFLNPIHANIANPRLWEGEAKGKVTSDKGLKVGYTRMRIVMELPVVLPTTEQQVRFAIACAVSVYRDDGFRVWAKKWVSGLDRTAEAAWAAAGAAAEAAAEVAWAAAEAADRAAISGVNIAAICEQVMEKSE